MCTCIWPQAAAAYGRDQRRDAPHRRLEQRFLADQLEQLLGQRPPAQRPEPRACPTGHDYRVQHDSPDLYGRCTKQAIRKDQPIIGLCPVRRKQRVRLIEGG